MTNLDAGDLRQNPDQVETSDNLALPSLPSLPASNDGLSDGNEHQNSNVTDVTEADSKPETITDWPDEDGRPCWKVYKHFVLDRSGNTKKPGVWYHGIKPATETQPAMLVDDWICSYLIVEAVTSSPEGMDFGRLLTLEDTNGKVKSWAMPMEMLRGNFDDGRGQLLSLGLTFDPYNRAKIGAYLMQQHPKRRVTAVRRTGWQNGDVFVMPDCQIGEGDYVFQSEAAGQGDYSSGGTMDGWQHEIGRRCEGNPLLMLAVCAALAGPLLHPLHKGNGGFHLVGKSSSGKSTAIDVACSVFGKAEDFVKTWRATNNGVEGAACLRNDTILVLDEIGEADPREIGGIIYAMGNGTGKQRADRTGGARSVNKWRLMLLSSGEKTIDAIMAEAGKRPTAGQLIRLLDIPADRHYGAFDDLHDAANGRELSDFLKTNCNIHYGHLGKAFLRELVADKTTDIGSALEAIKGMFNADPGQEGRGADRFAIVALAGEMAISYGLLPWAAGSAAGMAMELFNEWKNHRGSGAAEDRQVLQIISEYISRWGDSRFTGLHDHKDRDAGADRLGGGVRSGYWIEAGDDRKYRFTPEGLKEATKGFDINQVKRVLVSAGWLADGVSVTTSTPSGKQRLYQPMMIQGEYA